MINILGKMFHILSFFATIGLQYCLGIKLTAYISQVGIHGEVKFQRDPVDSKSIIIETKNLQAIDEQSTWSWSVHEFPVINTQLSGRCSEEKLGSLILSLDDVIGPLILPFNASTQVTISSEVITLTGAKGFWGRSLLIHEMNYRSRAACSTIIVSDKAEEKVAEARFLSPLSGSVFFRWLGSIHYDSIDSLIYANLHWTSKLVKFSSEFTQHNWKIYSTDILDSEADVARENCNFLQLVYDPLTSQSGQAVGDLDSRHGKLKVGRNKSPKTASLYHDSQLTSLSNIEGLQRSLYLVIFDSKHHDSFLACAKIRTVIPFTALTLINAEGISGKIVLNQRSPFDPTWISFNLSSFGLSYPSRPPLISEYKIHELPSLNMPTTISKGNRCLSTGLVYNPNQISQDDGSGSQDTYAVGDLSGKHNIWRKEQTLQEINTKVWDINLPLQGLHSVMHRSLVLYKNVKSSGNSTSVPWLCGVLSHYLPGKSQWKLPMFTAEVTYRYPIVGRMVFRQPRDQPLTDTTIIIEYLIHADGTSQNDTSEHEWKVHEFPPGKDFYNWTGRCLSSGQVYNPYSVPFDNQTSDFSCESDKSNVCLIGDLSGRHSTLNIAGRKKHSAKLTRRLLTDTQLPLSGFASIVGKSLVIYDKHGPVARGERLACARIEAIYRRKAVVKDWYGNSELPKVKGKIEFYQQTEYDITDVEADLQGLADTSGYHIHEMPVESDLEFPCEASTLYGHWNPLNISLNKYPPSKMGTTDQYEMGDLSGKFGTLDKLMSIDTTYNDTLLPLFGSDSILGRSVVIHKRERNRRWMCSSIERGYSPSEARELRAIASFHHPLGFAWGYVRMTQLVYNDGSKSETIIEVNLRHPGKNDRNITRNHNWAIYVNPVSVDASVKILDTRCVAGGYVWNPYYTQLAAPLNTELYHQECGPDNPLRCYVGDLSSRLGTINLGDKRKVFTDSNFPLEGDVSALGRSIIVFNKERGPERFACANIEPDKDIIKYVNVQRPPRYVVAQFLQDIQEVLGIPPWMLTIDNRRTKVLHDGACVQLLLHFKGPIANKLEQDFSRLMNLGRLESPSLYIPGYVPGPKRKSSLSYKLCGARDTGKKGRRNANAVIQINKMCMGMLILLLFIREMIIYHQC